MTPMTERERLWSLLATLALMMVLATAMWVGGTNERMAQQGFIPLRLEGDTNVYWLPIPTNRRSAELDGLLKKY